jgi:hypothetical protein
MFNQQCGACGHNHSPHEVKFPILGHGNIPQSNRPWTSQLLRSDAVLFLEHCQNEAEMQAYISSGQSGSFDSFQLNGSLALEAQQLWESVSRIRDPGSNCSSVCSSASTLSSATMCAQPQQSFSNSMANGAAPSFDFVFHRARLDAVQNGTQHTSGFAPCLRTNCTSVPAHPTDDWHPPSLRDEEFAQEQHLEEFSLGSGYPG